MVCGCVYHAPPTNDFSARGVEELTSSELERMQLTNLPIRVAHGKYVGEAIGHVTQDWSGSDGSKYVSFHINPEYAEYIESIKNNWHSQLSLRHDIDPINGMIPREVSICHRGAREGTHIFTGNDISEYKQTTRGSGIIHGGMDTTPDATPPKEAPEEENATEPLTQELTPEEAALSEISKLSKEQQSIIAKGWAETTKCLQEQRDLLDSEKQRADRAERDNKALRVVNDRTVKNLVSSIKEAYEQQEMKANEETLSAIHTSAVDNPVLASALNTVIPVLCSMGGTSGRKRMRDSGDEESDMQHLQDALRGQVRARAGVAAFHRDFANHGTPAVDDTATRMMNSLRNTLKNSR